MKSIRILSLSAASKDTVRLEGREQTRPRLAVLACTSASLFDFKPPNAATDFCIWSTPFLHLLSHSDNQTHTVIVLNFRICGDMLYQRSAIRLLWLRGRVYPQHLFFLLLLPQISVQIQELLVCLSLHLILQWSVYQRHTRVWVQWTDLFGNAS